MRLDKFLSNKNFGSRKDVKSLIKSKRVLINDSVATKSDVKLNENDEVCVDELCIVYTEYEYLILNKPSGYVSANKDNVYPTIFDILPPEYAKTFHIVGRLDVDTEGLVIITNDGDFTHKVISPSNKVAKKYKVCLESKILENYINILDEGVIINDSYKCMSAQLEIVNDYECILTIYEGKFHQVKKMFKALDNEVVYLKRIAIGNLNIDNMELGEYRAIKRSTIYEYCVNEVKNETV